MTSSGPPKCVYLVYRYIKVYWETKCERCEVIVEWLREGCGDMTSRECRRHQGLGNVNNSLPSIKHEV